MFGSAAVDFAFAASGRTSGCIVITKYIWDIAPGIFLCKEAGAIVSNLEGNDYRLGDDGVFISSNETIKKGILNSIIR